jgi:zinc protease
MDGLHRGSGVWIVVLGVLVVLGGTAAGCGSGSKPVRYGSLVVSERSFNYRHGVESFTLANGLVVALVPDAYANLVSVDVRYRVGAADDPPGKTGLAHIVEHMLFKPRAEPGGPTLDNLLAIAGLSHNAETSWDATHYHEVALTAKLDDLLAIEATRMGGGCAGLDQTSFDHELAVVTQEIAQRGTHPLLDAVLGDVFGVTHRYAYGLGGRDLAGVTLADVCSFVDAHYGPGQAILVIAGRFDPDATRRMLATRFASIPRRVTAPPRTVAPLVLTGGVSEHHTDTDEAAALVVFPAAPWGSAESFNDELIDHLLVQGLAKLDHDERWVTGVDAGHLGGMRNGARYFALSVADPARLDDAIAQIFRIAGELPGDDSGIVLGILAARRRAELFSEFESVSERGGHCADYLQFTYHGSFHLRELAALQAIDTDPLLQRAKHLTRRASHVVRVLPNKDHAKSHAARPELHATATIDAPVWQAIVDPAEADRPLALPEQRRPPPITELQLPNGLRVLMASELTQPIIEARLVFPAGDFNTGPNQAGVADAAAELLEHGTREITLKDFAIQDWVLRLGARLSAAVDEYTTFTVRGSSTFADWHVWRLHWLLENGKYSDDDVKRARDAAAEHAAHRHPGRGWRRALREALFGRDHPYARDLTAAAIARTIDTDDLEQFREDHYRANGATLLIVGQFEIAAMTKTVTELFGAWPADRPAPLVGVPAMRPVTGPTWIAHTDPDASQVRIALMFAATSPREPSRGARAIVGEIVRSRLEQVRTRLGASYGLETSYWTTDAGDMVTVNGYVDANRAGEVMRLMQADLGGLRAGDHALAADFVRARRTALARTLADPMMSSTVADELEAAVAKHRTINAAATLPAAIAATTLRDARAVIAADLKPERMVVLLSGRRADTAAAFAAAGVTHVQIVNDDPVPAR